jgi:hypothetical protein
MMKRISASRGIGAIYAGEIVEAYCYMESNQQIGKIVVTV